MSPFSRRIELKSGLGRSIAAKPDNPEILPADLVHSYKHGVIARAVDDAERDYSRLTIASQATMVPDWCLTRGFSMSRQYFQH